MQAFLFIPLFISLSATAAPNPVLGKWDWGKECRRPAYIMEEKKITYNTGTDGNLLQYVYKNVKYKVNKNSVVVDFGKPHELGKTKGDTKMEFKIISGNEIEMDRKKIKAAHLLRCP